MILLVAATEMELAPLQEVLSGQRHFAFLQGGVGLLETACNLSSYLHRQPSVKLVINFGVAGAYQPANMPQLFPCLATSEQVADLAVLLDHGQLPLAAELPLTPKLPAPARPLDSCSQWLHSQGVDHRCCDFASVNGVSGTAARGDWLAAELDVCCENMEGAAVARVCQEHGLDWLEIRTISNQVVDRQQSSWDLLGASRRCAELLADYCRYLTDRC